MASTLADILFLVIQPCLQSITIAVHYLHVKTKRMAPLPCFYYQGVHGSWFFLIVAAILAAILLFWSSKQVCSLLPVIFLFKKLRRREWHISHDSITKEPRDSDFFLILTDILAAILFFGHPSNFCSLSPLRFSFYKLKRRELHLSHASIVKEPTGPDFFTFAPWL